MQKRDDRALRNRSSLFYIGADRIGLQAISPANRVYFKISSYLSREIQEINIKRVEYGYFQFFFQRQERNLR